MNKVFHRLGRRGPVVMAALVLAVVLAPLMEGSLRQSLMLSEGSLLILVERPLSAALLLVLIGSLAAPAVGAWRQRRRRRTLPGAGSGAPLG